MEHKNGLHNNCNAQLAFSKTLTIVFLFGMLMNPKESLHHENVKLRLLSLYYITFSIVIND
jgi:hypothetical protein